MQIFRLGPDSSGILRQIVDVTPFTFHRVTPTIFRKIYFETGPWFGGGRGKHFQYGSYRCLWMSAITSIILAFNLSQNRWC